MPPLSSSAGSINRRWSDADPPSPASVKRPSIQKQQPQRQLGIGTKTRHEFEPDVKDARLREDYVRVLKQHYDERRAEKLRREFAAMADADERVRIPSPSPTTHRRRLVSPLGDGSSEDAGGGGDDSSDEDAKGRSNTRNSFRRDEPTEEEHRDIRKLLSMPEIDIPPGQRRDTPIAMSCTLMEHQKVCLTWLIQQEEDSHKKGGILADTMGLGKTIQALALILARPSPDRFRKTTLIVAPLALLKQWQEEIRTKVKPDYQLKTLIFHGPKKRGMTVPRLLSYDVILTTYGTVVSERKRLRNPKKPCILLDPRTMFYRIILDEAHLIKNRTSKSADAVSKIQSVYRWCMTGTPFMNRTGEIFSLIRFLRIAPYNVWEVFTRDIDRPIRSADENNNKIGLQKLQALFRSITLRRTKQSMLDGKPILRLPELIKEEVKTVFDEDQQAFYDALEHKQRLKVNEFIKAGTVMKKYTYILVLLLRLRQTCCHPHLIRDFGIPDGARLGPDEMRELALRLNPATVARLKEQEQFECPFCDEETASPVIIYPCGHTICGHCFSAAMEVQTMPGAEEESACPHPDCDVDIDPEMIICWSYFLEVHAPDSAHWQTDTEEDPQEDPDGFESWSDDSVDKRGNLKGFVVSDDEDDEGEDDEDEDKDEDEEEEKQNYYDGVRHVKSEPAAIPIDEVWKDVSDHKRSTSENRAGDSDLGSLASLEDIWRRVEAMKKIKDKFAEPGDVKATPGSGPTSSKRKAASELYGAGSSSSSKRRRANDGTPTAMLPRGGRESKARGARAGRDHGAGGRQNNYKKKKGKKRFQKQQFTSLAVLKKQGTRSAGAKARYLARLRRDWVPSAKINKAMELLREIRGRGGGGAAGAAGEKTLVFSLWTSFLDLLEVALQAEGFRYGRYDGTMGAGERDAAVRGFMGERDGGGAQVLLVSLAAGNAGLNLTAATHVILLEPFWNPYVEDQAVDRAHRIGQPRPVTVHRLLVAGTVEDRIRALQDSKRSLVNAALSEEDGRSMGRLSLAQLKGLFGIR